MGPSIEVTLPSVIVVLVLKKTKTPLREWITHQDSFSMSGGRKQSLKKLLRKGRIIRISREIYNSVHMCRVSE